MTDYAKLLPIAMDAVDLARAMIRSGKPGHLTAKGDRDMATELDYAVERALRTLMAESTPDIAFLGEEDGATEGTTSLSWTLDPIDGTVNLLHGHPLVGVSLALVDEGRPVLGVIDTPFLTSRYWAVSGEGAFKDGHPIHVSTTGRLSDAVVATGDYAVGMDAATRNVARFSATRRLATAVQRVRMHGSAAIDLAFLAAGTIDAVVMLANNSWDVAAGVVIVREAGGLVLDMYGQEHTPKAAATIGVTATLRDDLLSLLAESGD